MMPECGQTKFRFAQTSKKRVYGQIFAKLLTESYVIPFAELLIESCFVFCVTLESCLV